MFNTSTLITLGLTALLCGIIMFYCKRKFAEYEQKLDVMSDLISNIITQLNQIPPSVYDNSGFMPPEFHGQHPPGNIDMNIVEDNDDDNEGDNEGDNEVDNEVDNEDHDKSYENTEDKRIIVNLSDNYRNEENTISLSEEPLEEDSWDSEESDDEDLESNKITIQEPNTNVVVESEMLNNVPVAETVPQEMVNKIVEEVSESQEVKVIDTNAPVDIDYSKMQVGMLKKMVAERKLAQGVSKMKKQELIDVLMNKAQQSNL